MIRTEAEYQEAQRRLAQDRDIAVQQRAALAAEGLTHDEVERAMEPLVSFHAQLADEVSWYEKIREGNIPAIRRLTDIGRLLIAVRIAQGVTQRELAERLGVSETVISRDERNEYHGITTERAQRIFDALHTGVTMRVDSEEPPRRRRSLVPTPV